MDFLDYGPKGGVVSAPPQILPIITAAPGVRSKIAAIVARDFAVTPLKIAILGDSNSKGGSYNEWNTTARIGTFERLSQYINSPATGFATKRRPFESGMYVPFGPVPASLLYDEPGNFRCQNSSNWIKVSPPAVGFFTAGQSSFVKDPASAGYAAMRLDRRASTYAQYDRKHDFERTATRMKLFFSVGQTSAIGLDRSYGNTSMATGAADATVAGNGFHGAITVRFWDLVGAASISSTTITPTTTNSRGLNGWGGWTSDWISLPSSGTYPWIEIRCETGINVRVAIDGIWFDDSSPRVQIFDGSYPGRATTHMSPKTHDQTGTVTASSLTDRRNYFSLFRHLVKTQFLSPVTFDATDYALPSAPTHYPLFSGGLDAVLHPCVANDIGSNTPARIKADLLAIMAEFVVDNPNGIWIQPIICRGFAGGIAGLDSYIAGTATVGSVPNQSWAMYRQAIYEVQAAYPNNFAILDLNQAIINKYYAGVQPTATQMNTDLSIFSGSDSQHTESWVEDNIALSTSLFLSGKI
jgi:hypothetical protein